MKKVTVFEVHMNGRPYGNFILEQKYAVQEGSVEENVIIDQDGFWQ